MNDPHVEELHYTIKHGDHVDYTKTGPFEHDGEGFHVRIEDCRAKIFMNAHFASVEGARAAAETLLWAWELDMALRYGPGALQFVYQRPVVIDRRPEPGVTVMIAEVGCIALTGGSFRACVGFAKFPAPPTGIARDKLVDDMFAKYVRYRNERAELTSVANYCLTALVTATGGGRKEASKQFSISRDVLGRLATLAANKGGAEARKANGSAQELTTSERRWLEEVMPLLIRRASEIAFDPHATYPLITMANLPTLAD